MLSKAKNYAMMYALNFRVQNISIDHNTEENINKLIYKYASVFQTCYDVDYDYGHPLIELLTYLVYSSSYKDCVSTILMNATSHFLQNANMMNYIFEFCTDLDVKVLFEKHKDSAEFKPDYVDPEVHWGILLYIMSIGRSADLLYYFMDRGYKYIVNSDSEVFTIYSDFAKFQEAGFAKYYQIIQDYIYLRSLRGTFISTCIISD